MSLPTIRQVTTALLAAASTAACGRPSGASQPAPEPSTSTPETSPTPSTSERVRADSLRRPYTKADVQFMTDMIGHHAQALVMAAMVPTREADPAIGRLAERIINAQQDEIATMDRWLAIAGNPCLNPGPGCPIQCSTTGTTWPCRSC